MTREKLEKATAASDNSYYHAAMAERFTNDITRASDVLDAKNYGIIIINGVKYEVNFGISILSQLIDHHREQADLALKELESL